MSAPSNWPAAAPGCIRASSSACASWRRARPGCRGGWWCSAFPRCRPRRCRRWRPWRASPRCCSACTTPAAITGAISFPTRTCCATSTAASSARAAWRRGCPARRCTSTPTHCWRPGASRAAITSTCWTCTTNRSITASASRRPASASTCSAKVIPGICSASCRTTSSTCARWPRRVPAGRRSNRLRIGRSASTSPTAPSARWRSCTTSCWRISAATPACARGKSSSWCRTSTATHRISRRCSASSPRTTRATSPSPSPTRVSAAASRC